MAQWKIQTWKGLVVGAAVLVFVVAVDVALIWLATQRPVAAGTFLIGLAVLTSLGFLGLISYWLYGLANSGYFLDRNALVLHWGPTEQTIPISQIKRVFTGDEIKEAIHFYGGRWPGHFVGYGEIPEAGTTLFYATVSQRKQIFIVTPGLTYGISPAQSDAFIKSLRQRIQMGPTQLVELSSKRPGFVGWQIWRDKPGLMLLAANVVAILGLVGVLCYCFPSLPNVIPLHFDPSGVPDRLGARADIFMMPIIGSLSLVTNASLGILLQRDEKTASHLLWGGALFVQVLVWAAAVGILLRI